jgi:hypothetical protein
MSCNVTAFHLMTSSNRFVGITECRELRSTIVKSGLWHNVHTKFHKFPPIRSVVTKCEYTDIPPEGGVGVVRLG